MQILVTSPIPSHPQNHGNRARVYSLCRTLQDRGYKIHFVYGGLEGLTQEQELAMRDAWDHVYVLPHNPNAKKQSHRKHHLIDDWYIPEVSTITARILRIWKIDICLANYVWFSRWLEDVPADMPRYIDTHDMFAGRHQSLKKDGLTASWYSTTTAEEAKAFERATSVLAIQKEEAKAFKTQTKKDVATLGHYMKPVFLPSKAVQGKLKVGYLASNNPINQHSLHLLWQELKKRPALFDSLDIEIAGAVSTSSVAEATPFKKHGFVDSPADFYKDMDIILNPNLGGTGLKIKSIEALAYGKPLVATIDAMAGIDSSHPHHNYSTLRDLVDGLLRLTKEPPTALNALSSASKEVFTAYQAEQSATLDRLFPLDKQEKQA